MTERLYYHDAYRKSFDAKVLACEKTEGETHRVQLDQSAFYPTSGGQPYDTGTLGTAHVLDVYALDDGEIWHVTDEPLTVGQTVSGAIDWARRFDHMQQHAGDHIMAGIIYDMYEGFTIGLHVGAEVSTIDVQLPDGRMRLSEEEIIEIERRVNTQIQQNLPIRCWFPTPEEMDQLPLRKDPSVDEHIRVVMVGKVECVACGGTHPDSSGQVGLLKILDTRPSRGKLRITFVCGMRAVCDYQMKSRVSMACSAMLSSDVESLPEAIERTLSRMKEAEHTLKQSKLDAVLSMGGMLLDTAETLLNGWRVAAVVMGDDDVSAMRELAKKLTQNEKIYALLASHAEEGAQVLFARSEEKEGANMGKLLSGVVKPLGGKGGGRPDFAQGSAPGQRALEDAVAVLKG